MSIVLISNHKDTHKNQNWSVLDNFCALLDYEIMWYLCTFAEQILKKK